MIQRPVVNTMEHQTDNQKCASRQNHWLSHQGYDSCAQNHILMLIKTSNFIFRMSKYTLIGSTALYISSRYFSLILQLVTV